MLKNGNIIVTDGYGNNRVVLFSKDGKFIKQVGKGGGGPPDKGTGNGEWVLPHKLAVDADENLYIIDRENHRVQVFDKNLTYIRQFANEGWNPWDIGISRSGTDGFAFIADHALERVHKIALKDGKILATWGKQGWGPGEFDWVHGIVVDSHGAVYAADTYGQRLQKFVPSGVDIAGRQAAQRLGDSETRRLARPKPGLVLLASADVWAGLQPGLSRERSRDGPIHTDRGDHTDAGTTTRR